MSCAGQLSILEAIHKALLEYSRIGENGIVVGIGTQVKLWTVKGHQHLAAREVLNFFTRACTLGLWSVSIPATSTSVNIVCVQSFPQQAELPSRTAQNQDGKQRARDDVEQGRLWRKMLTSEAKKSRNQGIKESRNRGIKESRSRGIKEPGTQEPKNPRTQELHRVASHLSDVKDSDAKHCQHQPYSISRQRGGEVRIPSPTPIESQ
eukprot:scaffold1883_cov261-Pinguiococcus_pyrenoidosus.AAC.6